MDQLSKEVTSTIIIAIFCFIVGIGIIIMVLSYQKKQLHYLRERESLRNAFEKEILESRLEIQEQTFKNISQEIHDNIGQILSLAKLNVNTIDPTDPAGLQDKLEDTRKLIGKAIQDLRDLSKTMNTDFVQEIGLVQAIEYELQLIKKIARYSTTVHIEGSPIRLSAQHELILFRIFQEVINNIIKHARATEISLHLFFYPNEVTLEIRDNGQGFTMETHPAGKDSKGLGIQNMKNRAQLIGATLSLHSSIGTGTVVTIKLPLRVHNEAV